MRSYIDGLYKIVELEKQERELAKQQEAASLQTILPPVKPLEQQMVEFFRSLSASQINRPWSLREITSQLEGKYRDRPHPQLVANELLKLSWQRRRLYGAEWAGRRYWFPPA